MSRPKITHPVAHKMRCRLIEGRDLAMRMARVVHANTSNAQGLSVAEFVKIARDAQHSALAYKRQDRVQS